MRHQQLGVMVALAAAIGCGSSHAGDDGGGPDGATADGGVSPTLDAGPEPCDEPGAIEMVACGMCGTATRFCTAEGVWMEDGCEGESGECTPGTIEDASCGMCGTVRRRCTSECTWDESAGCQDEGECVAGTSVRTMDGCPASQQRELVCDDSCTYVEIEACMPLGCPTPGATETVSCGTMCGTQTRSCNDSNIWEYSACVEAGECVPGSAGTLDCGACGEQPALCTDACGWMATAGACTGEGLCTPGDMTRVSTGCAPHESRPATCDATCGYASSGACEPLVTGPFVVVPYMSAPDPGALTLDFATNITLADVYFLFDITGSMAGEIDALQAAVTTIMNDRSCADSGVACTSDAGCPIDEVCSDFSSTCIESPAAAGCVADLWTGTGYYETDYVNALSLQGDPAMTSSALATFTTFGGTEELHEALLALADPSMVATETGCTGPTATTVGCPAFRSEARRIAIVFTDEDSDGSTTATAAGAALAAQGITLIGVWSGIAGSTGRADLVDVVTESGSFRADGVTPLVYDGMDSAVVPAVTAGIDEVLTTGSVRVTIDVADDPSDAVDATQFIERFQTNTTGSGCTASAVEDSDGDGFDDTYGAATPGTRVCFDLVPRRNDAVAAEVSPQVYPVRVTVYGDGAPLDSQVVSFIVPSDP